MTDRQDKWVGYAAVVFVVALAVLVCWIAVRKPPAPTTAVRRELAAERIPQIEAKAKTTRRAARAKVDTEVTDAARASDLVEYTNSRRPH